MPIARSDIRKLKTAVQDERRLMRAGLAYLHATSSRSPEEIDAYPPQMFMLVGRRSADPGRFADREFLRRAATRRKHIAVHHYPMGEDRAGCRYPPR